MDRARKEICSYLICFSEAQKKLAETQPVQETKPVQETGKKNSMSKKDNFTVFNLLFQVSEIFKRGKM